MTRRNEEHIHRKVLRADIPYTGERKTVQPNARWKDGCHRDMKRTGLRAGGEFDREIWSMNIISHSGDPMWREKPGEKKKLSNNVEQLRKCARWSRQVSTFLVEICR